MMAAIRGDLVCFLVVFGVGWVIYEIWLYRKPRNPDE
jgi:hypothetical protein